MNVEDGSSVQDTTTLRITHMSILNERGMRRRGIITSFLVVILFLVLLNLGPNATLGNSGNELLENDASVVDLNALMLTQFQEWDAALTRWASVNGSLSDPYDRAQAVTNNPQATLSGMGSLIPWMSFYQATGDVSTSENCSFSSTG